MSLSEVKVGDSVTVIHHTGRPIEIVTVERVLATQIVTHRGQRFNRRTGNLVGSASYSSIVPATQEHIDAVRAHRRRNKLAAQLERLEERLRKRNPPRFNELTDGQIDALLAALAPFVEE